MVCKTRLRLAKPRDLKFVVRGIREIFAIEKKPPTKKMLAERCRKARAAIRKREVLIAEGEGGESSEPVGFLCFEVSRETPFGVDYGEWSERFAWVSWSFVDAAHRGKGVGKALYAEFERECRRRGVKEVMLDVFEVNARSRAFHKKLGFKPLLSIFSKKTR